MDISFSVPFIHGLQRHRMNHGHAFDTKRNVSDKAYIAYAYKQACIDAGKSGARAEKGVPVTIEIDTYKELPASRPKRVTSEPDVYKADVDNVCKEVLDALNNVAWHDDAQIVTLTCHKHDRTRGIVSHTDIRVSWNEQHER